MATIDQQTQQLQETLRQLDSVMRAHSKIYVELNETNKAALSGFKKINDETEKVIDKLHQTAQSHKQLEKIFKTSNGTLADVYKRRERIEHSISELRKMGINEYTEIGKSLEQQNQFITDNNEAFKKSGLTQAQFITQVQGLTKTIHTNIDQQARTIKEAEVNAKRVGLGNSLRNWAGGLAKSYVSILAFNQALVRSYNDLNHIIKFGQTFDKSSGVFRKVWEQNTQAMRLGLNSQDYAELSAQHRAAILAVGGGTKAFDQLNAVTGRYRSTVGTLSDTTKFLYGQMSVLGNAGISPTSKNLSLLQGSFNRLHTLAGMTGDEFNALTSELVADTGIREQLAAVSEEERARILQGITARIAEHKAMGISVQQATAMAKTMARIAGTESPAERIKRGARLAATAGALGVQGAGDIVRLMATARAGTPEAKRLDALVNATKDAVNVAKGSSNLGTQQLAFSLSKGQEDLLGPDSPFGTRLAAALKPQAGIEANTATLLNEDSWLGHALKRIEQAMSVVSNPVVQGLGSLGHGIISAIGLLAGGKMLMGGIGGIGGKLGGGVAARFAGAGIGRIAGGALGALGGPAGIALGALAGGAIGTFIGKKMSGPSTPEAIGTEVANTSVHTEKISNIMTEMNTAFKSIDGNTNMLVNLNKQLVDLSRDQLIITSDASKKDDIKVKYSSQPRTAMSL